MIKIVASLQPANEVKKRGKGAREASKIKNKKFAKLKKVLTFAVPKERVTKQSEKPEAISGLETEKVSVSDDVKRNKKVGTVRESRKVLISNR